MAKSFVAKALSAARKAISRNDCHHADYWIRQIGLRAPAATKTKRFRAVADCLRVCYRKKR